MRLTTSALAPSVWRERLLAALGAALVINLAWAWLRQYANEQGNPELTSLLGFRVVDPPFMPQDAPPSQALVGLHHFGDLTVLLGYAKSANPYVSAYPSQHPPIADLVFAAMASFGYRAAFVAFVVLTFLPIVIVSWIWLRRVPARRRILAITLIVGTTLPAVTSFDRGALALAAVGGAAVALLLAVRGHPVLSGAVFVVAASVKPYLFLLLLYPLLRGHLRYALSTGFVGLLLNVALFAAYPGGFTESIKGFLIGLSRYSGADPAFSWVSLTSESAFGAAAKLIDLVVQPGLGATIGEALLPLAIVPGLIWLLVAIPLIAAPRLPPWLGLFFAFAATMIVVPSSAVYTTAWAIVAAIAFSARSLDPFPPPAATPGHDPAFWRLTLTPKGEGVVRWIALGVLVCNLTPFTWSFDRSGIPAIPAAGVLPSWAVLVGTVAIWAVVMRDSVRKPRPDRRDGQHLGARTRAEV